MASHKWAMSWPGNFCTVCGAEDAMENAIGMGWYDPISEEWLSPHHERLVYLCNTHCFKDMPQDEIAKLEQQMKVAEEQIHLLGQWDVINERPSES